MGRSLYKLLDILFDWHAPQHSTYIFQNGPRYKLLLFIYIYFFFGSPLFYLFYYKLYTRGLDWWNSWLSPGPGHQKEEVIVEVKLEGTGYDVDLEAEGPSHPTSDNLHQVRAKANFFSLSFSNSNKTNKPRDRHFWPAIFTCNLEKVESLF